MSEMELDKEARFEESCRIISSEVLEGDFKFLRVCYEHKVFCATLEGEDTFEPMRSTSDGWVDWDLSSCFNLQEVYDVVSAHRSEHWTEELKQSYIDYMTPEVEEEGEGGEE